MYAVQSVMIIEMSATNNTIHSTTATSADSAFQSVPRVSLFGMPVAPSTMSETLDLCGEVITSRQVMHIGVINAAKVVNSRKDPVLRDSVLASDIIYADGMAVVWASRFLGRPLPERVAGIDIMMGLLERGDQHGYRVFLLGAKEAISEEVERRIQRDYPGVNVVGRRNGYFNDDEEAAIVDDIAACNPDILFVAITSPKKERFLAKWADQIGAHIYHGVGGSFDVYAGFVERAPERWQKLGLEWLYRVKQEPRRLWKRYLVTNVGFLWLTLKERFVRTKPTQIGNSSAGM
ncbi:MAG: WecB/TagA/CpsF family glycosyltransferase [Pseudomonadota bacterium]